MLLRIVGLSFNNLVLSQFATLPEIANLFHCYNEVSHICIDAGVENMKGITTHLQNIKHGLHI